MLQKYQNEISPIIYYGISTKINEKDLKIPILQPPDWKSPYWMSLYLGTFEPLFVAFMPLIIAETEEKWSQVICKILSSLFNQDLYLQEHVCYVLAAMARGVTKTIFCNHINEMIVYLVQIRNISSRLWFAAT